jgi:hypothetical protein
MVDHKNDFGYELKFKIEIFNIWLEPDHGLISECAFLPIPCFTYFSSLLHSLPKRRGGVITLII